MTEPLGFSRYIYVVRGARGLCLAPSFLCVLLLQVNLCEAAAISSFICRQAWQQGRRENGGLRGGGGVEAGGGEKEGEQ